MNELIEAKPKYQSSIPASTERKAALYAALKSAGVPILMGSRSRIMQGVLQAVYFAISHGWKYDPAIDD